MRERSNLWQRDRTDPRKSREIPHLAQAWGAVGTSGQGDRFALFPPALPCAALGPHAPGPSARFTPSGLRATLLSRLGLLRWTVPKWRSFSASALLRDPAPNPSLTSNHPARDASTGQASPPSCFPAPRRRRPAFLGLQPTFWPSSVEPRLPSHHHVRSVCGHCSARPLTSLAPIVSRRWIEDGSRRTGPWASPVYTNRDTTCASSWTRETRCD